MKKAAADLTTAMTKPYVPSEWDKKPRKKHRDASDGDKFIKKAAADLTAVMTAPDVSPEAQTDAPRPALGFEKDNQR
ncbi:hypothetical protein [Rhizobium sp. R693]|uniref:hypothetical protein n=1 Tax=Rhizobium sp. R693 TaxID=1764276 RepID=UPI0011313197|nr:hypothetical protein [Rhizobium sp. R693]